MSTNINRHQAGATVAGEKTGGQFKAGERTAADDAALAAVMRQVERPKQVTVTAPARSVTLDRVESAIEWPEALTSTRIDFGEDDSGRFFTVFEFEHAEDGEMEFIYTDFEDGPDFSDSSYSDHLDGVSEQIAQVHDVLRRNHHRVGAYALENDSELYEQVKTESLGQTSPFDSRFDGKPQEGALHRAKNLLAAYGVENPDQVAEHVIQDMLTDLVWLSKSRGFDFDDLALQATSMQSDEELYPNL